MVIQTRSNQNRVNIWAVSSEVFQREVLCSKTVDWIHFISFEVAICALILHNIWYFIEGTIGRIFLRRFRLYVLSFMFWFMFANIRFEKNQNRKIHVMFIINIKWNETWNNQVLPFVSLLSYITYYNNIGFFFHEKIIYYDSCNQTWHES